MAAPCAMEEIEAIQHELLRQNDLQEGSLYMQVTRGAVDRDFAFPKDIKPSLIMFTQARGARNNKAAEEGISVVTLPDIRWQRRDIKTVGPAACFHGQTGGP